MRGDDDGGDLPPPIFDDVEIPYYCELALASRFTSQSSERMRYCEQLGGWYIWDGARWKRDDKRETYALAQSFCRSEALNALAYPDAKITDEQRRRTASSLATAKKRATLVDLAREIAPIATSQSEWDRDLMALNTPVGTIDLKTGKMMRHRHDALHSKSTAVAPSSAPAPMWRAFLEQITGGDIEIQAFLRRVIGYCLTGKTTEHALFFFYGTGANGKGVFLNTITAILGDYGNVSPMETFTATNSDRHPTELAMLRGARMVAAQETESGRRWAESRIKALTGGDPITARFMRQDFFTYTPQFKLLIAGNHKPILTNIDEAMRRRLNLIPFTVTIPPDRRDPNLAEKLKAEWPQILGWAIRGCREWQDGGLCAPTAVSAATDQYFAEEDLIGQWLEDCCSIDQNGHEQTRELFASWSKWATAAGAKCGRESRFREALLQRGLEPRRMTAGEKKGTSGIVGLTLLRRDYTDDPRYGG